MIKKLGLVAAALSIALSSQTALAKVSAEEAAKLGDTLTPLGAEKAGFPYGGNLSNEYGQTGQCLYSSLRECSSEASHPI